jgi:hypothetical protein
LPSLPSAGGLGAVGAAAYFYLPLVNSESWVYLAWPGTVLGCAMVVAAVGVSVAPHRPSYLDRVSRLLWALPFCVGTYRIGRNFGRGEADHSDAAWEAAEIIFHGVLVGGASLALALLLPTVAALASWIGRR